MSEEILKALMQLFAIIAKQDEGVEEIEIKYVENFLATQLSAETVGEYIQLFKDKAGLTGKDDDDDEADSDGKRKPKLTSVRESVKVLGLCKKINKTLNQKQKVVVLVRLFELVNTSGKFTAQRMAIINTVAEVFNITKDEYKSIESFATKSTYEDLNLPSILIINSTDVLCDDCKKIKTDSLDGNIIILRIQSEELYFLRYTGAHEVLLNGLGVYNNRIYLFASGSTIKLPKGKPIYYSDVVANFMADKSVTKLSYTVDNVSFRFPNGELGLRNINFSEGHGKLVGIMGASGAGKTTLLNLLSGINSPTEGAVLINGINMHKDKSRVEGVIGYIPQDDLLIEELTVFENLYYNAKLCFKNKSHDEIVALVEKTLKNLGLHERKDLKVGNIFNKLISGGQRKRLNIALELIREPSILFVDEPTSGLSSRDSENVMDLLRELTLKGKLIFVVIHQPSSEIYKMFDKMIILDTGGYLIYYGNPVEAIVYFKTIDNQINAEVGECPNCGNVTPETIFNVVESKVVDEFGQYTSHRKYAPVKWEEIYHGNLKYEKLEDVKEEPPKTLSIPNWFKQFRIYTLRDFFSKVSNTQYVVLNLIESPLLGLILAFLIRYIVDPKSSVYIFYNNENIPPYIFMSVIVALFLGLTVSAEEIFRDRKILKREKFLNLSRSSYLMSKILILTVLSAIQAILFVIVGNAILGIQGMVFEYWMVLFSTFVFANMMGLNISATFNSAVTIYILIPLLIIPQMALGGAMFSFEKLNRFFGGVDRVPIIAEFMTSRWSYEALMVNQYVNNDFEKDFYDVEKRASVSDFKTTYYLSKIDEKLTEALDAIDLRMENPKKTDSLLDVEVEALALVKNELSKESRRVREIKFDKFNILTVKNFNENSVEEVKDYINKLKTHYSKIFSGATEEREAKINRMNEKSKGLYNSRKNKFQNERLADIVKKVTEKNKILVYADKLVQQLDPIYLDPEPENAIGFRAQFYAPKKMLFGKYFDTFWFNVIVIWLMTILLYPPLYGEHLRKIVEFFGRLNLGGFLRKVSFRGLFKKKKVIEKEG